MLLSLGGFEIYMMLTFVKHLSLISQLIFNNKIILNNELVGG
jgi:hypothetical protein